MRFSRGCLVGTLTISAGPWEVFDSPRVAPPSCFDHLLPGEIAATIIRAGDVWGPGSKPWTIIPLEMIAKGQRVLPANGSGVFSPIYIDNLVDGIILALGAKDAAGQIYSLTDGYGISCADYFGRIAAMAGGKV